MKDCYIYFLTNWTNDVLYIGVTSNLERTTIEHQQKLLPGFSKKYNLDKLVYYEHFTDMKVAIEREKQLKNWNRKKKDFLVTKVNPDWSDLHEQTGSDPSTSLGMTLKG